MTKLFTRSVSVTFAAFMLVACGDNTEVQTVQTDRVAPVDPSPTIDLPNGIPAELAADNKVLVMVERLVPEDEACLLMMSVVNGTDDTVTAGLFAFDVTGNGETAGANMFPQTAAPDTMTTAQIVLPGADCDDALMIEGGELNCKLADTGESCIDVTELRDGVVEFSAND